MKKNSFISSWRSDERVSLAKAKDEKILAHNRKVSTEKTELPFLEVTLISEISTLTR